MEFQFDENNAIRNEAFLNKTKNQAKNLLKLAKKNQLNISIENLSKAQEVLAQINGFPNWHALEKTISSLPKEKNMVTNLFNTNKNLVKLNNTHDNIPYLIQEDNTVVSFIKLTTLPTIMSYIGKSIDNTLKGLAFDFNMDFYKVNLLINNQFIVNKSTYQNKVIGFHNGQQMDQKLFEQIFTIDLDNSTMYKNYNEELTGERKYKEQSFILSIETDKSLLTEHIQFCKLFKNDFMVLGEINQHDYNNFLICRNKKDIPVTANIKDLIEYNKKEEEKYKKCFYALQTLFDKGNNSFNVSFNTGNIYQYNQSNTEDYTYENKVFINGLFKSLKISELNKYISLNFKLEDQIENTGLPCTVGIPLYNVTDKLAGYYMPVSSVQNNWITLISGKPGSGKSILINSLILATCFAPGLSIFPSIGLIDIGPSAKSTIEMLKHTLPQHTDKIAYHILENNTSCIINPFDTKLGMRYPSSSQSDFLVNLIKLLTDPRNEEKALESLARTAIDFVYTEAVIQPKLYNTSVLMIVDEKLKELDFNIDRKSSWWEVVDFLFNNNEFELAKLAQRYAVPLLRDLIEAVSDDKIKEIYNKIETMSQLSLIKYFSIKIKETLTKYTILSCETNFDIDKTDINIIDLDKVMVHGSEDANHQGNVMYMLATYLLNTKKNYYLDLGYHLKVKMTSLNIDEELKNKYKQYHYKITETLKFKSVSIFYDEFHRANLPIIKEQVENEINEARMNNVAITISSQAFTDFTESIFSLATSIFVLDSMNKNEQNYFKSYFSPEEILQIEKAHGPRYNKAGVFFMKLRTNNGIYSKLCTLELPPLMSVALSTTAEDAYLRSKLIKKLGYLAALKIMRNHFWPTVKNKTEKMIEDDKKLNFYDFSDKNYEKYCDILFDEIMLKIENI